MNSDTVISVIGLGYVGLPIALSFAKHFKVIGYDTNEKRITELRNGIDRNKELSIYLNDNLQFTSDRVNIRNANFHIVCVPTPVDEAKKPDLSFLESATMKITDYIKPGDTVVYESTVWPGVTRDQIATLELSGLTCGIDFGVGYSPERINPGDTKHTLENIVKLVAGSDDRTTARIVSIYESVLHHPVYVCSSIEVAEAAKIIENIQRDVNIALVNELSMLFNRIDLDTREVLEAAGTKWNFLKFWPGLVGGHCIGVDPYYLTHLAAKVNYTPQMILSGRRINDEYGVYIAREMAKALIRYGANNGKPTITIFGFSFKANVSDIRNTRVIDIYRELKDHGINVKIIDPLCDAIEIIREYGIQYEVFEESKELSDGIIIAVDHDIFREKDWSYYDKFLKQSSVALMDLHGILPRRPRPEHINLWRP